MGKSEVIEIVKQYALAVNEKMKPEKVILYGSYASGNWQEDSDIDVAVVLDTVHADCLESMALLYKLRRGIDDRIEPVLLEKSNDSSGFLAEIMKYGQIVFTQ
jgi:predicted nucleotidyltransferase